MFRFANNELLFLLLIVPLLVTLYYVYLKIYKKSLNRFVKSDFWPLLMPQKSNYLKAVKFILLVLSIVFIIIAVARPQFGSKLQEVKREGIEMVIAIDISKSMLAQDIKPNRLLRARQAITTLINRMKDDKIGIIVFAGDAYTQLPITSDYESAKLFLSNINPNIVSKQGTAISSAIELGMRSFTQDEEASKVIVVISDGETHEGNAYDAAKKANEKGIKVYTIGMGSPKGAPIPSRRGGYLKDRQDEVVISRMDAKMLSEIAQAGDGEFYSASTSNVGLNKLYKELNSLNKSKVESKVYSEFNDQYQYFIAMALLLLMIDFLITEKKSLKYGVRLFD